MYDFKAILCLETIKFGKEGVENHYDWKIY